jgi:hypothetical protein
LMEEERPGSIPIERNVGRYTVAHKYPHGHTKTFANCMFEHFSADTVFGCPGELIECKLGLLTSTAINCKGQLFILQRFDRTSLSSKKICMRDLSFSFLPSHITTFRSALVQTISLALIALHV